MVNNHCGRNTFAEVLGFVDRPELCRSKSEPIGCDGGNIGKSSVVSGSIDNGASVGNAGNDEERGLAISEIIAIGCCTGDDTVGNDCLTAKKSSTTTAGLVAIGCGSLAEALVGRTGDCDTGGMYVIAGDTFRSLFCTVRGIGDIVSTSTTSSFVPYHHFERALQSELE